MTTTMKIMVALALLAIGAAGGWIAQGWRKDAVIADLERGQAQTAASQYKAALDDFKATSDRIKTAAAGAKLDLAAVANQLAAIRKDFKNAQAPALPPDCRPDAIRVRQLTAAAGAVDQAIAGPVPSRSVQAEWPAGR